MGIREVQDEWKVNDKILLVVLQNPYKKGELRDKGWSPTIWRKEFESSRSGTRLLKYLPAKLWHIKYANANPAMGDGPDSKLPADPRHLTSRLNIVKPTAVLACGDTAREAIASIWKGPLFCIPHPAHRLLTDLLIEGACRNITDFGIFYDNPELREAKQYNNWEIDIVRTPLPRLRYIQNAGDYKVVDLNTEKEYGYGARGVRKDIKRYASTSKPASKRAGANGGGRATTDGGGK